MTIEDCKRRGLIKKNPNAPKRIEKEIISAEHFLKSAENISKIDEFDLVIISSYNSCFHFLRALLYKKNYVEKSHYCLIEMLRRLYSEDKELLKLLDEFDKIKMSRHEIQYRGIFSNAEESEYILEFNKRLKEKISKLFSLK